MFSILWLMKSPQAGFKLVEVIILQVLGLRRWVKCMYAQALLGGDLRRCSECPGRVGRLGSCRPLPSLLEYFLVSLTSSIWNLCYLTFGMRDSFYCNGLKAVFSSVRILCFKTDSGPEPITVCNDGLTTLQDRPFLAESCN